MKIIYIIGFFKRHDLTRMCFDALKSQGCEVYTVGSEGEESKSLAEAYGHHYIEHDNNPLGAKMNALIKSLEHVQFDYACLLGSDNFVSDNFHTKMVNYLDRKKPDYTTFKGIHFYNQNTKLLTYYEGYTGVGRMFSKGLIESCGYTLWMDNKNSGLDTSCEAVLSAFGYKTTYIDPKKLGVETLDVKYSDNITTHDIVSIGKKNENISIDLRIFDRLENYNRKRINLTHSKMKHVENVRVVITKDVAGLRVGDIKVLRPQNAKDLIRMGVAEVFDEQPITVKKTRQKRTEK